MPLTVATATSAALEVRRGRPRSICYDIVGWTCANVNETQNSFADQRKQVVSQVPRFARRLFRERTAFLSTEVGEILLLRVHARNQLEMKFRHLALSCRRTSRPTCASILVAPPETRDAVRLQTRSSILREGSRMAGISIKGQLFGISNLKARRYAIDVIDHGAEKPASRNGIPAAFRRSSS